MKIYQVDAFTSQLFGGNPAAVCPLEKWLPSTTMQAIAAENNLSETAFVVRNGYLFDIRWFTPTVEVDLCGHATLASAHVLFEHEGWHSEEIIFSSKSGRLLVRKDREGGYIMNFPTDELELLENTPEGLNESLGIEIETCYRGNSDYMVVLENQEAVEAVQPNFEKLGALDEVRGVIVTAVGDSVDFVSRGFYPQCGVNEDPATGSAHTTLTKYWTERLEKKELIAQQLSNRLGEFECTYLGDRTEIKGQAQTYMIGKLMLDTLF
ncbi:MAG: PhzF family phenazine biosynthesis protein [Aureispira sp.]|nr:PhzF family phenazine biosynthesis protein [Aureispira sp.]